MDWLKKKRDGIEGKMVWYIDLNYYYITHVLIKITIYIYTKQYYVYFEW